MNTEAKHQLTRRAVIQAGAGIAVAAAWPLPAFSAGPIRMVVPLAPGGGVDIMMRLIGQKLSESWNQPVIIDSKPGANGAIAAIEVIRSEPDASTLLAGIFSVLSGTVLNADPGYQLSQLEPIAIMGQVPQAFGVRASLGVTTLEDFIRLAKENPNKFSYGSAGVGATGNFVGEQLNASAGIDTAHIPYAGEALATQAVVSGEIEAIVSSLGPQQAHSDNIVTLAITGPRRFSKFPDVPTFAEAGLPDPGLFVGWIGMMAPAGSPKAELDRLSAELVRIVNLPEVGDRLLELGIDPVSMSAAEANQLINDQLVLIKRIVDEGRINQ